MKKLNYALALVAAYVVVVTMFIMTADVTARAFRIALPGAVELTEIALALMVFLGWSFTQEQKGHIAIDFAFQRLPQSAQRVLDIINPFLGFIFMAIIAWQGYRFAMYSRFSKEITENLSLPIWPFKMILVIGAGAFCLQLIADFTDAIRNFRKP
jgi:TRAP-type C4-dicarboxylate transport system permease small subunit